MPERIQHKSCFNVILTITLIIITLSTFSYARKKAELPYANHGILYLSEKIFDRDSAIDLRGEWELYWHKLYSPLELGSPDGPEPDTYMQIPGRFDEVVLNNKKLPKESYATLRLKIVKDSTIVRPLALRIGRWSNALHIWINNNPVASVGKVGTSVSTEEYDSRPQVVPISSEKDTLDIVMQVSNFRGKKSACTYPLKLGIEGTLVKKRISIIAWDLITFGAVFVIGLCLTLAYLNIKPTYMALFFLGVACLTLSVRSVFMGQSFINDIFPSLPSPLKFKMELTLLYTFVIFMNMYCRSIFPEDLKKWYIRVVWISHLFFILIVLLFNYDIALLTQTPHHLISAFSGIYVLVNMWRILEIHKKDAAIFMISIFVFFLTVLNDILVYHHFLETPYILHFGFLIFIIIQTYLVTHLYSKSKVQMSALNKKLTNLELLQLKTPGAPVDIDVSSYCNLHGITSREKEVVELVVQGLSNNEIAQKLFISFHTVRRHLNNIYRKCGVSERSEFMAAINKLSSSQHSL